VILIAIAICFAVLGIAVWLALRVKAQSDELQSLRQSTDYQQRLIAALTRRVWLLETGRTADEQPAAPAAVSEPEAPPIPETAPLPEPVPEPAIAAPTRVDWETRVGANWLNRAGSLILVVGIVLFLGYSLTQLGPAGKVAIGFLAGTSLLAAGAALERHERYRNFALSFMAAGWAVVYFTAYAMHGVPAARIIDDAALATTCLLAVSAGMILHALRYRSETAVGLAYLFGFVSLNVSPLTSFSVVASLVLALSLVALAYCLNWFRLPLAGVVFTYVTFMLRYDTSIYGQQGVLNGQVTLWIYWAAFEVFDLLDMRRRGSRFPLERSLLLLNACGFAGASVLHETRMNVEYWSFFLAASAAAYMASAFLRARLVGANDDIEPGADGYEAASTVAAAFLAGALIERFSGLSMTIALLLEGEMIVLSGLALRSAYLTHLGTLVLILPFFRILAIDAHEGGRWTPLAAVMAAVFAVNRRFVPRAWYFAAAAGVLVFAITFVELKNAHVAPAWAGIALAACAAGERFGLSDVRWMSLAAVLLAFGRALSFDVPHGAEVTAAMVAAALYVFQWLWRRSAPVSIAMSMLGTGLVTAILIEEVSGGLLTVALGIEGAALLAAGFLLGERVFRLSGLVLFLVCIAKLFIHDLRQLDMSSRILSFVVLGLMLIGASWVYTRFRDKLSRLL
jgi:hypothetical protein